MNSYLQIHRYEEKFSIWHTPPQPSEMKTRYTFEILPAWLQEALAMLDITAPNTVVSGLGFRTPRQGDGGQMYFVFNEEEEKEHV